jgi:hypothetical protein
VQTGTHALEMQEIVPFGFVHVVPHAPQFIASVLVFVQAPPHAVSPTSQGAPPVPLLADADEADDAPPAPAVELDALAEDADAAPVAEELEDVVLPQSQGVKPFPSTAQLCPPAHAAGPTHALVSPGSHAAPAGPDEPQP